MKKGLICWIYRNGTDCSNNGISSRCDKVVLVGEGIPEIFEAKDEMPAVYIEKMWGNTKNEYVYARPIISAPANQTGYMMGGCFIYSCDSRFPYKHPIALHDRTETWEQYNALSI